MNEIEEIWELAENKRGFRWKNLHIKAGAENGHQLKAQLL